MVHIFVMTTAGHVFGKDRIAKALQHFAIQARQKGEEREAAVEVNVERVEERIVRAFANEEVVVLVPDGSFRNKAQGVESEGTEFGLLLLVLREELCQSL